LIPYNAADNSGTVITTPTISLIPTITFGAISVGTHDISMSFSNPNTIYDVSVARIVNGGSPVYIGNTTPLSPIYYDIDTTNSLLFADSSYSYRLAPRNSLGVYGTIIYSPVVSMNAQISIGAVSITSSTVTISLIQTRLYSYVSITPIINGTYLSTTIVPAGTTIYQDPSDAFFATNIYQYAIVPYNVLDIANNAATVLTSVISVVPTVTFDSYLSINAYVVQFQVTDATTFSYLTVTPLVNGTSTGNTQTLSVGTTLFTDTGNFTVQNQYSYVITPYNALGVAGTPVMSPATSLSPTAMFLRYGGLDTSSVTVYFGNNNNYQYVAIAEISGGQVGAYTRLNNGATSYTMYHLMPTIVHQFNIVPYNSVDVSGPTVTTPNVSSVPTVRYGVTSISTSYLSFNVLDNTTFNNVSVARMVNGKRQPYVYLSPHTTVYTDPSNMFAADCSYQYSIVPYNALGTRGTTILGTVVSPPATVSFGSYTSVLSDQIQFTYYDTMLNYYYVIILPSVNGTEQSSLIQPIGRTSFTDTANAPFSPSLVYRYKIVPYNALNVSNDTAMVTTVATSPLPSLYFVSYTGLTTSQVQIQVSDPSNYAYMMVTEISGGVPGTPQTVTNHQTYLDENMFANVVYSYNIVPYNAVDVSGTPINTTSVSVIPVLPGYSTSVDVSSITIFLNNSDTFYYVTIQEISGGVVQNNITLSPKITTYTDYHVSPNVAYQYNIIPFNILDVSGTFSITEFLSPIPTVSFASLIPTYSSMTVQFDSIGSFYDVSIARITDGVQEAYVGVSPHTTTYVDSGIFTADNSYSYVIIPYNILGIAGTSIHTTTVSTIANVAFTTYSNITTSSLQVNFVYSTSYEYVLIAEVSGGVVGSYQQLANGATSYVDTNLSPNVAYQYNIIPYNGIDVSGTLITTLQVSVTPTVTFTSLIPTPSSMTVQYESIGSFYDVSIARITDGVQDAYVGVSPHTTTYVDSGIFTADNSYTYMIVPHNILGDAGTSIRTTTVSTTANVAFASYSNITNSSLQVNFVYSTSYEYVLIAEVSGGVVGSYQQLANGATSYVDTNLSPNVSYQYNIVPYNGVDVPGTLITTPATSVTPTVTFTSLIPTPSSMTVQYANIGSFYDVSVARITNGIQGAYINVSPHTTTYVDSGTFTADNSYAYMIVPHNILGVAGTSIRTTTVSTTANVTFASYSNITASSLQVNFMYSTSYEYVLIAEVSGGVVGSYQQLANGATSYVDTNLSPNVAYQYNIIPYNGVDVSGTLITTPNVSVTPTVTFTSLIPTSSSMTVQYANIGSFYDVSIARITNAVQGAYVSVSPHTSTYVDSGIFTADSSYSYLIVPHNILGVAGTSIRTTTVSTTANVTFASYSNITTSNVKVNFMYSTSYEYVLIAEVSGGIISSYQRLANGVTTYTDTNLSPNVVYQYKIVPYNGIDVSGTLITTPNVSVTPTVTFSSLTPTPSNMTVQYTSMGSFYNVSVARITNGILGSYFTVSPHTTTYVDSGTFTADSSYAYSIMPYNANGVAGTAILTTSVSVPPSVSFIPYVGVNDISLGITTALTNYKYLAFTRQISNLSFVPITLNKVSNSVYQDVSGPFAADASYTYTITPYNVLGTAGTTVTSNVLYVNPSFSVNNYVYSAMDIYGITLSFTHSLPAHTYSYLNVARIVNGIPLGTSSTLTPATTTYTDPSNVISADNSYSYVITPYNANNTAGTPFTTTTVSPTATVMFINYNNITTNSLTVNYAYGVSFDYVTITEVSGGIVGSTQKMGVSVINATYTNRSPDISYIFVITPYNALDAAGSYISTPVISVIPSVTNPQSTITSSSLITTFSSASTFYDVSIALIFNGIIQPTAYRLGVDVTSYTDPSSVFSPLNKYAYAITPYNVIGSAGQYILSTTVSVPASISATSSYSSVTGNTIINLTSLGSSKSYSTTAITRISTSRLGTTYTPLIATYANNVSSYTDTGPFTADTSYSHSIVPANVLKQTGTSVYTSVFSPTASVSITNISVTYSQLLFTFASINTFYDVSIALINNGVVGTYYVYKPSSTSLTFTDPANSFTVGTTYAYSITPRNAFGQLGTNYITSTVTPPIPPTYSTKARALIDTASMVMYYVCDFVTSTLPANYTLGNRSNIDTTGMIVYYNYDVPLLPSGTISTVVTCTSTSSVVAITYSASCYSVYVARIVNGTQIENYQYVTPGASYTDPSSAFYPFNLYSYVFIPYNLAGFPGTPYTTTGVTPISSISTGPLFSNYQDISFVLYSSSTYYTCAIQLWGNGSPMTNYSTIPYGTTIYIDSSITFSPDVSYNYQIIPYNTVGLAGPLYTTSFTSPLPYVVTGTISYNNTNISVPMLGTFTTVSVVRMVNGQAIETPQMIPYGITVYIDPSNVFYGTNLYSYSIIPYSQSGVAGLAYTTNPVSPLPSITIGSIGNIRISGNDSSFAILSNISYSSVSVARLINGYTIETTKMVPYMQSVYIDPSNVFYGANTYSYAITPYNIFGVAGSVITTYLVSPVSYVTAIVPALKYQTILLNLVGYPSYYQVAVRRLVNRVPIDVSYQILSPGVTVYTDPSNSFFADVSYSYSVISYNALGAAGSIITTPTFQYSLPLNMTPYVKNMAIVSTANIQMYYSFEPFTIAQAPSYNPKNLSVIDTSMVMMYYGFDL
jgi:hypothetical protein